MRSTKVERKRLSFDGHCQWPDLFKKGVNWKDFTVLLLAGEYSGYKGSVELEIGLLGFVAIITYTYDFEFVDSMGSMADEIIARLEAEHPGATVDDPNNVLDALRGDDESSD